MSVVVPTFGRPDHLERALASVLAQTYEAWELLVVDDNGAGTAASRATERLVARFGSDDRIRYLQHRRNEGGSTARNTGVRQARGEYVAFLDDDDEWLPHKLWSQLEALIRLPPKVGAIYSGYYIHSSVLGRTIEVEGRSYPDAFPRVLAQNFIGTTSTLMCRASVFEAVGPFDTEMPAAQDREFLIRLCRSFDLACIRQPLVRFHWHEGDRITKRPESKLRAQELLYERYAHELRHHPRLLQNFLIDLGKLQLRCGRGGEAARSFLRAWAASPMRPGSLLYAFLAVLGDRRFEWIRQITWRWRRGSAGAYRSR